MQIPQSILIVILFVVLTPGILLSLPPGSSKLVVAVTHAIVFLVIYHLTLDFVLPLSEGFKNPGSSGNNNKPACAVPCKQVKGSCS